MSFIIFYIIWQHVFDSFYHTMKNRDKNDNFFSCMKLSTAENLSFKHVTLLLHDLIPNQVISMFSITLLLQNQSGYSENIPIKKIRKKNQTILICKWNRSITSQYAAYIFSRKQKSFEMENMFVTVDRKYDFCLFIIISNFKEKSLLTVNPKWTLIGTYAEAF